MVRAVQEAEHAIDVDVDPAALGQGEILELGHRVGRHRDRPHRGRLGDVEDEVLALGQPRRGEQAAGHVVEPDGRGRPVVDGHPRQRLEAIEQPQRDVPAGLGRGQGVDPERPDLGQHAVVAQADVGLLARVGQVRVERPCGVVGVVAPGRVVELDIGLRGVQGAARGVDRLNAAERQDVGRFVDPGHAVPLDPQLVAEGVDRRERGGDQGRVDAHRGATSVRVSLNDPASSPGMSHSSGPMSSPTATALASGQTSVKVKVG